LIIKPKTGKRPKVKILRSRRRQRLRIKLPKKPKKNAKWKWDLVMNTAVEEAKVAIMIATKVETMIVTTEVAVMEIAEV